MLQYPYWDKPNQIRDDLLGAADVLEKHGHVKQKLYDSKTGRFCALGAIGQAAVGDATVSSASPRVVAAANAMAEILDLPPITGYPIDSPYCGVNSVVRWNNAPERTAQEVIDGMRLAAAKVPA